MEETGEPCSGGPPYSIEEYERSKDTPVSLSLKKIRCDDWWECRCSSVSHTEEDTVKIRENGRRENGEYDEEYNSTNRADNPHGKGNLPSDLIL